MEEAKRYMHRKEVLGEVGEEEEVWTGPVWTLTYLDEITKKDKGRCIIVLDGFVVDAAEYLKEHVSIFQNFLIQHQANLSIQPGGARLLRQYAFSSETWRNSDWAFHGGLNNHSSAAKRRMKELRIAKIDN